MAKGSEEQGSRKKADANAHGGFWARLVRYTPEADTSIVDAGSFAHSTPKRDDTRT